MLARIQAYQAQLAQNPSDFFPPCCPCCQERGALRAHELRARGFWCVIEQEVERVRSFVLRVACKICRARTTVLPDFAFPHKRYTLPEIIDSADRYVLDDSATYRSVARVDGRPVFHDDDGASRAASTVHRWIGFLGSLVMLLAAATDLLQQADPGYSPLAEMRHFAPGRYRSNARRECLERALRLLRVRDRLNEATQAEMFPSIATPAVWS